MSISFGGTSLFLPTDNPESSDTSPKIRLNRSTSELQYYRSEDQSFNSIGYIKARYWRYVHVSAINGHHPRVTRIMLHDENGTETIIVRYANDVISGDVGNIPGLDTGSTLTYDFGSPVRIVAASIYSGYAIPNNTGGARSSVYRVEYSQNNSNWETYFSGVMANHPPEIGEASQSSYRARNNWGIWFGTGSITNITNLR